MKILLISNKNSTFVKRDYNILKSKHNVTYCLYANNSLFQVIKLIRSNDLILFWFASIRFLIPVLVAKILKKKIITITGGFDVAKVESGSMGSTWKSLIVKSILNLSDKVLAVSNSNMSEVLKNCKIDAKKVEMIYHGFEESVKINLDKKKSIILTIGYIDKLSFTRKGIDKFFSLAELIPEVEFHLIGEVDLNSFNVTIPDNVILHGHLNFMGDKFVELLEYAKIYIQFSKHESFGCSVAEAMQFGCFPIVSDCYSLPEVVGNCGLIISNFENFNNIAANVRGVLNNDNTNLSLQCIERVKTVFSFEERKRKLISAIDNLD